MAGGESLTRARGLALFLFRTPDRCQLLLLPPGGLLECALVVETMGMSRPLLSPLSDLGGEWLVVSISVLPFPSSCKSPGQGGSEPSSPKDSSLSSWALVTQQGMFSGCLLSEELSWDSFGTLHLGNRRSDRGSTMTVSVALVLSVLWLNGLCGRNSGPFLLVPCQMERVKRSVQE